MEGIAEPVAASLERELRRAVLQLVSDEPRRRFAPALHVGSPSGRHARFAPPPARAGGLDQALRADVVAALVRRTGARLVPLVWLARCGDLDDPADADADWLAAARTAFAEAGLPLTMVVVTRQGWRDPRSGTTRRWRRLRDRSRAAAASA